MFLSLGGRKQPNYCRGCSKIGAFYFWVIYCSSCGLGIWHLIISIWALVLRSLEKKKEIQAELKIFPASNRKHTFFVFISWLNKRVTMMGNLIKQYVVLIQHNAFLCTLQIFTNVKLRKPLYAYFYTWLTMNTMDVMSRKWQEIYFCPLTFISSAVYLWSAKCSEIITQCARFMCPGTFK